MDSRVTSAVTIFAILAMATLIGLPKPAAACTCAAGAPIELLETSDLAFIGSVVDQQPDFAGTSTESLIAVDTVVKGDVSSSIIVTGETESACGLGLVTTEQIALTAVQVSGEILPKVCTSMEPDQLLAAADELGLDVVTPLSEEEVATALPESTSSYAAAIPLSIALSLVFLGAVALGTRQSVSSK